MSDIPKLKTVSIPEAEVLVILKSYFASLPAFDRAKLGGAMLTCHCVLCSYLRERIDPRL